MKDPLHPRVSKDKRTVEYDEEDFRNSLPNLASELDQNNQKNEPLSMKKAINKAELEPSVIGFIRRCNTNKEAIEIIEYMLKRNEISKLEAEELQKKIEIEGLDSFGPKKRWGYYERNCRQWQNSDFDDEIDGESDDFQDQNLKNKANISKRTYIDDEYECEYEYNDENFDDDESNDEERDENDNFEKEKY